MDNKGSIFYNNKKAPQQFGLSFFFFDFCVSVFVCVFKCSCVLILNKNINI